MATEARLTVQDLLRFGDDGVRRELVDGKVIEMPPHGGAHGKIAGQLYRKLAEYLEQAGGGEVMVGGVGFVLRLPSDPERVRAPDVAFVARERLPGGRLPQGFILGTPDLAVEVLSPSDTMLDVQQRVRDYLDAGTRLVWLVAPQARTLTVYRADGSAHLLRDQDVLDGEDVLPGLVIPLSDVLGD